MARRHANPLLNPNHYATPHPPSSGPPASYATAQRNLKGYDYVIVGAGAAGCVLASKLSEDKNVSVLLLEAGGDHSKIRESQVPLMFTKLFHSKQDWNYYTKEQPNLGSRSLFWPRGKVIGGSTSLNAMMYHHCSKSDFDEWADVHGCTEWSYNEVAPYLRRMERFKPSAARPEIDPQHRGTTGEWHTGNSWLTDISDKGFIPACQQIGLPEVPDINTMNGPLGVTRFPTFIDSKGQRSSFATAYLTPTILNRPNLSVACHAHASRLLVDTISDENPTIIGAEIQSERGAVPYLVHARKEVILSGGSVNTPQILMLSGIGPAQELEKHGLPHIKDLEAVGQHLKDHLCATPIMCKAKPGTTLDYLGNVSSALPALARWLLLGSGPLTSNAGEAAAFIRTFEHNPPGAESFPMNNSSGKAAPDVEIIGVPLAFIHHGEETPPDNSSVFTIIPIGLRPKSEGSITLKSRDPFDHAIIDPKYFSDEGDNDRTVLLTALRVCLQIMRSPAFQKFLEPIPVNDDPTSYWWPYSCSNIDQVTDKQLRRFMDEKAFTLYHPVGTARMGTSPSNSVVDLQCRVHGVNNLRVMDASVFPEQISGHPTAPIGALAYKLSEMIKNQRFAEAPVAPVRSSL